ncbi:MAG: radical SAM protein, partial [Elusimicrobiaceae bacterium]|nr:radical SAM protein [Elusimicrobiaceae bacterium]
KTMKQETQALCPVCLKTIPAIKVQRGSEVWLEKTCPEHGSFSVQVAKDAERFFDKTYDVEGKPFRAVTSFNGDCGPDCGWCNAHKQHICTGLIEITEACNLACPICYFGKKSPQHISVDEFKARLKTLLTVEQGHLDVLQISGGECLLHPRFKDILQEALQADIGRILINTNGLNLLTDRGLFNFIQKHKDRVEIYLQFDGFDDEVYQTLRGQQLVAQKREILLRLFSADIKVCLAVTVYQGNLKEIPAILKLAVDLRNISGITFQRLTKVGSAVGTEIPSVMQEDILLAIANSGYMKYKDLIPLPCSHENCTSLGFLFCQGDKVYSLGDYIDYSKCKTQLSNRIAFDKTILDYMQKNVCKCFVGKVLGDNFMLEKLQEFAQGNGSVHKDMKIVRIIVKNFMDADTFDWQRAQKCCTGVSIGNERVIPFCVYNTLKGSKEHLSGVVPATPASAPKPEKKPRSVWKIVGTVLLVILGIIIAIPFLLFRTCLIMIVQ